MFVRPSFKPFVKELFLSQPRQNICHILSWEYMDIVMTNLVEQLPTNQESLEEWKNSLWCFVNSICLPVDDDNFDVGERLLSVLTSEHAGDDQLLQAKYINIAVAMRVESQNIVVGLVEYAKQYVQILALNPEFSSDQLEQLNPAYHDILQLSNELLDWLHSMPTNLKIGDASWNKSIGGAVDPRTWLLHKDTVTVINNLDDTKDDHLIEINGPSFELTHMVDQEQLMWAFAINGKYVDPATYLYTGIYQDNSGNSYWTVCSSSNSDSLVNSDWKTEQIPMYSFDRLQNGLVLRYYDTENI